MPLIPHWFTFKRPRKRVVVHGRSRHGAPIELPVLEEDERPKGCGWFDSSHELLHGLVITEAEAGGVQWLH